MSKATPEPNPSEEHIQKILETIGDICHEHYLGCEYDKPNGTCLYEYDTEVIHMLQDTRIKKALYQFLEEEYRKRRLAEVDARLAELKEGADE